MKDKIKREKIKEFDIARAIAIICMIAVHTEFAIYDYNDEVFATIFDYLGSPFAAPIFMFILGANIVLSRKSQPKKLFIRGISLLGVSYLFNIVSHALPFFIIDYKLGMPAAVEDSLHWIFAVDILSFAGLAFIFFGFAKKYKISNKGLIAIGFIASLLNTLLIKNGQIDFNTYPIISGLSSLFFGSSEVGYFSFLGWIIFPIAGYVFVQKLLEVKDKDKFYNNLGIVSLIAYLVMVLGSFTIFTDSPLVVYTEEYSYYWMNPYQAVGNIFFCLAWLSILYFVSKKIPTKLNDRISNLSSNLTNIYLIQWFVINYVLVLPFNGQLKVGKIEFIILFMFVFVVSDILAQLNKKYKTWKMEALAE